MSRRQQLADDVVKIACGLLALAFLLNFDRPMRQEFANDAAQQQRHMDRLEKRHPGVVARVIAASEGTR